MKVPQHFSDVRVAYRRYGDMLKENGFRVEKKLFDITPPPDVKPRLLNETSCYTAKK